MNQEQKTFRDMNAYLKNAGDMVEVAIVESRYYAEYIVRHLPPHLTEQKILAELASHFRTQGFRVMLFQYEAGKNSKNFLRIMWSENPYNYPEERSLTKTFFSLFSRQKAVPDRPILFGRAKDACLSVLDRDKITRPATELILEEIDREFLTGKEPLLLRRTDLERILLPLSDTKASILTKLNTRQLIQQIEARGYRVKVQRMFLFTIEPK